MWQLKGGGVTPVEKHPWLRGGVKSSLRAGEMTNEWGGSFFVHDEETRERAGFACAEGEQS